MRALKPIGASENSDAAGPDSDVMRAIVIGVFDGEAEAAPGLSATSQLPPITRAVVVSIPNRFFIGPPGLVQSMQMKRRSTEIVGHVLHALRPLSKGRRRNFPAGRAPFGERP